MAAAEAKSKFLKLLDEVDRTREPVTVTKRGRPLAVMMPIPQDRPRKSLIGCMKGTILRFDDPFSPAYDGPWNAELGLWEPEP